MLEGTGDSRKDIMNKQRYTKESLAGDSTLSWDKEQQRKDE